MGNKSHQLPLNFNVNNGPLRKEETLFLTYIRTSQQHDIGEIIKKSRRKLRGKTFSVRRNPPSFCKRNSIMFLRKVNSKFIKADIKKIKCNSWTCPSCNVDKAIKAKYLIRDVIIVNDLHNFLTLTLDPNKVPPEYLSEFNNNTHKYITKIFNAFLVSLKRNKVYKDQKIKYLWVIEFQKNGNAHLHILFNLLPHINNVREIWERVGGGVIMKVLKIKSQAGISNYIGNYIVKGIKGAVMYRNTFKFFEKRYSISRSCTRPANSVTEYLPDFTLTEKLNSLKTPKLNNLRYDLIMGNDNSYDL